MRVVILGANGQVASEVTLMLSCVSGIEVRPVVRTRGGSAFLRYSGIPVEHGDIGNPDDAPRLLKGATVIANFALASGTPAEALARNSAIIRQTYLASPSDATVVFFSTLSVHGQYDKPGRRIDTFYGKLRLKNETLVSSLAQEHRRKTYILRLGHVAGEYQGITAQIHREIAAGLVGVLAPDQASNITFTEMISEALLSIASGNAGPPGLYDLVNLPQWTWREVYSHEAHKLGKAFDLVGVPACPEGNKLLRQIVYKFFAKEGLKERILRWAIHLPGPLHASLMADYYVSRARTEIQQLTSARRLGNSATFWPEIPVTHLSGLRSTRELIETGAFPIRVEGRQRWPADLVL